MKLLKYVLVIVAVALPSLSRAGETQIGPDLEKDIPLAEAIKRLNELFKNVPALTEEEVIAAVRTIRDKDPGIEKRSYEVYQRVASERVLPKGMHFERNVGWITSQDGHFKNDRTDLTLTYSQAGLESKYAGYGLRVRDKNNAFRPLAGWETRQHEPLTEAEIARVRHLIEEAGATNHGQATGPGMNQAPSAATASSNSTNTGAGRDYPPSAAHDLLETACKAAASQAKAVFINSGTPECGWCRVFSRYHNLPEVRRILGKYYVNADLDIEYMPDGEDVFSRFAQPGTPAWVIISPQKNVIVDSYSRSSNVGYPIDPEEMSYYLAVLRRATPAITDAELRALSEQLKQAAGR